MADALSINLELFVAGSRKSILGLSITAAGGFLWATSPLIAFCLIAIGVFMAVPTAIDWFLDLPTIYRLREKLDF